MSSKVGVARALPVRIHARSPQWATGAKQILRQCQGRVFLGFSTKLKPDSLDSNILMMI